MAANLAEKGPAREISPGFFELPVNNTTEAIVANVRANLVRALPFLSPQEARSEPLAIVGGGPSLETYLPILRSFLPDCHVLAVNGSYKYLRERGIDPEYFMLIDSRAENITHVENPSAKTQHFLATQVHPSVVDALDTHRVTLFNLGTAAAHRAHRELGLAEIQHLTAPVGMASVHAVYLAAALGYRTVMLFGYDFSHKAEARYAFEQPMNANDDTVDVQIDGKRFRTTMALARTAEQFFKSLGGLLRPPCNMDIRLMSDGLLRAVLEHQLAVPTEESERQKYEDIWNVDAYRRVSPGLEHVEEAIALMGAEIGDSIVDFGCGTGRCVSWFLDQGFGAIGVDIAGNALEESVPFVQAALWDAAKLPVCDYGFSNDVLEHIPTDKVDATLAAIRDACRVACYLNIDTIPDAFGAVIGRTLHETVQPGEWWEERLRALWPVVERVRPEDQRQAIFVCRKGTP